MFDRQRPTWQLPEGVSPGTWDYTGSDAIATGYVEHIRDNPLMQIDEAWTEQSLREHWRDKPLPNNAPRLLADLGCGTGRIARIAKRLNCRYVGIDLSQSMLSEIDRHTDNSNVAKLRMNLADLSAIRDQSIDAAVCLFSSLGMVRSKQARAKSLAHIARTLKPHGLFLLHVHNRWASLFDYRGPSWLIRSWLRSRRESSWEFGDRVYPYLGLPNMYLHSFDLSELSRQLLDNGFRVQSVLRLNLRSSGLIAMPNVLGNYRAGGFLIAASKATHAVPST